MSHRMTVKMKEYLKNTNISQMKTNTEWAEEQVCNDYKKKDFFANNRSMKVMGVLRKPGPKEADRR